MARLYTNENFPLPVVEELRQLGHNVLTTHEAGEAGKSVPDEQVLAFATDEARALVTLNRKHFIHFQILVSQSSRIIFLFLHFRILPSSGSALNQPSPFFSTRIPKSKPWPHALCPMRYSACALRLVFFSAFRIPTSEFHKPH